MQGQSKLEAILEAQHFLLYDDEAPVREWSGTAVPLPLPSSFSPPDYEKCQGS